MEKSYIPKNFPEKCMLLGGGQLMNSFMIVNVLRVYEDDHPFKGHEKEKILRAEVEERDINGIIICNPYLLSYYLYPLKDEYKDMPLDDYILDIFDGTAKGEYTSYIAKNKEAQNVS